MTSQPPQPTGTGKAGPVRERFAANLRRARKASGISQAELGVRSDMHRTEISLLERAGREPRLGTIVKVAGALGVTPQSLCIGMNWVVESQRFEIER